MNAIRRSAIVVIVALAANTLVGEEQRKMPTEIQQYLQSWVGEYDIEGMWGDQPVKGRLSARLSRGRHANLYDWSFNMNGEALHISSVEGWDSVGGWTIEQGVASDGEISRTRWTSKAENLWVGESKGTVLGQPTSNTVTIEMTPNGFTAKVTESKRGNVALPDMQLKYTRIDR